jgi:tetratricopeptide (TPR) repeat protein
VWKLTIEKGQSMNLLSSLRERLREKRSSSLVPGSVMSLRELAYSSIQRGDYLGARELLVKALEQRNEIKDPAVLNWLWVGLAWTWTVTEQYRDSTEFFSNHITRHPNDVIAYTLRAGSLWHSGELRQAIDDYSRALELDAKDILAHMGRGQVFAECGEFSKAIEDLNFTVEHLEQAPITDAAWRTQVQAYSLNGRAVAHAGLGNFERALEEFEQSISLCPDNAWVYFNRAMAYENTGQKAKAVADYKLALQKTIPAHRAEEKIR